MNLSFPGGASVNDGIKFTLHYITVDQIICLVSRLGKGALMVKFDLESAYHNVPVHLFNHFLLGMKWCTQYHIDLALPFKLQLAPFINDSDKVEWTLCILIRSRIPFII